MKASPWGVTFRNKDGHQKRIMKFYIWIKTSLWSFSNKPLIILYWVKLRCIMHSCTNNKVKQKYLQKKSNFHCLVSQKMSPLSFFSVWKPKEIEGDCCSSRSLGLSRSLSLFKLFLIDSSLKNWVGKEWGKQMHIHTHTQVGTQSKLFSYAHVTTHTIAVFICWELWPQTLVMVFVNLTVNMNPWYLPSEVFCCYENQDTPQKSMKLFCFKFTRLPAFFLIRLTRNSKQDQPPGNWQG